MSSPTPSWVVRGGLAAPDNLRENYGEHSRVPGLFGCSTQYQPGRTIEELAAAGQFRNPRISYAANRDLIAVAKDLGYDLSFVRSPGRGYHHTMMVRLSSTGEMLQQLPADLALALSAAFRQMPNPARVPHERG